MVKCMVAEFAAGKCRAFMNDKLDQSCIEEVHLRDHSVSVKLGPCWCNLSSCSGWTNIAAVSACAVSLHEICFNQLLAQAPARMMQSYSETTSIALSPGTWLTSFVPKGVKLPVY